MPTNHYFNNYGAKYTEQRLVEDLVTESIKIMGTDCYYLPNDNENARDLIYGEDPLKSFNTAFAIELYPSNVMEYGGDREFFSKFGLEIRSTMTMIMSKRSFAQRIANGNTITRPREGDLIYIPVLNGYGELFEIKFVNQNKDMAMLGRKVPYFYEMELEKFKYSQETISTGIEDIDLVQDVEAYSQKFITSSANGTYQLGEVVFQSTDITIANSYASGVISYYDPSNNILELTELQGEFRIGSIARGQISNARCILSSTDEYLQSQLHADYDNKNIHDEANTIIDFSESNPFGNI
jgi:hypothetical protein